MAEQLILDITGKREATAGDFLVSPANAEAVAMIENDHLWPGARLVLTGPEGAGKSHLATRWAESRAGLVVPAEKLRSLDRQSGARGDMRDEASGSYALAEARGAGPLDLLARHGALAIEDVDRIAGDWAAEELLFHLFNAAVAAGTPFLVTSRTPPARLPFALPDLSSRLAAMHMVSLSPPDDALLRAVLIKLFAERQIAPPPGLIRWLLPRMERSFAAARALVAEIDRIALAEGRPVGRAVAARALDTLRRNGPDSHKEDGSKAE